jgi:hypothetical protein
MIATQHMPVFAPGTSAIAVSALRNGALLAELQGIVARHFPKPVQHYLDMDSGNYRTLVAEAQDEVNRQAFARRLAEDRSLELAKILGSPDILLQTNLYLRAARPARVGGQEQVGWHRESFYGPDMAASVNLWMPLSSVTADTALRYIPGSHLIPDDAIETEQEADPTVTRFSAGHRIGLLYAPKKIVRGVDLAKHRPMMVELGEVAIFAGALIHGAGENRSDQMRFSVDFRLIAADNLTASKPHFASGKPYFEAL